MDKPTDYKRKTSNDENWIEPLRRHSWEMELLITGFVVLGLFQIPDFLDTLKDILFLKISGSSIFKSLIIFVPIRIIYIGVKIMTINLIILLLLRGFWIGMIGLNSAFPDGINFAKLSFSKKFSDYLQKKSIDAEKIIINLDNICSSIFALSFLIFFITISLGLYTIQLQILTSLMLWTNQFNSVLEKIFLFLVLFYLIAGLLKLIDFLSVGKLKKIRKKWWLKIYFPISHYISYVTLAFIYRPIYYLLVSNFSKKIFKIVLLLYMLITVGMFFGFTYNSAIYYPDKTFPQHHLFPDFYQNQKFKDNKNEIIKVPLIQSDIIKNDFVKLFIPYDRVVNKKFQELFPDLKPLDFYFEAQYTGFFNKDISSEDVKKTLDRFAEFYTIAIDDSVYTNIEPFFYKQPYNKERGIMMYLNIEHLNTGKHTLDISKNSRKAYTIHFWKE